MQQQHPQSTTITKLAFVRGIAEYAQKSRITNFSTPEHMKAASDWVASQRLVRDPATHQMEAADVQDALHHLQQIDTSMSKTAAYVPPTAIVSIGHSSDTAFGDLVSQVIKEAMGTSDQMGGQVSADPIGNSAANASTRVGQQENTQRPMDYAQVPMGGAGLQSTPGSAMVGLETAHPLQDSGIVYQTNNSAIAASSGKSAHAMSRPEFLAAAGEVLPLLPANMPASEKVATCQKYAAQDVLGREVFRHLLAQQFGAR